MKSKRKSGVLDEGVHIVTTKYRKLSESVEAMDSEVAVSRASNQELRVPDDKTDHVTATQSNEPPDEASQSSADPVFSTPPEARRPLPLPSRWTPVHPPSSATLPQGASFDKDTGPSEPRRALSRRSTNEILGGRSMPRHVAGAKEGLHRQSQNKAAGEATGEAEPAENNDIDDGVLDDDAGKKHGRKSRNKIVCRYVPTLSDKENAWPETANVGKDPKGPQPQTSSAAPPKAGASKLIADTETNVNTSSSSKARFSSRLIPENPFTNTLQVTNSPAAATAFPPGPRNLLPIAGPSVHARRSQNTAVPAQAEHDAGHVIDLDAVTGSTVLLDTATAARALLSMRLSRSLMATSTEEHDGSNEISSENVTSENNGITTLSHATRISQKNVAAQHNAKISDKGKAVAKASAPHSVQASANKSVKSAAKKTSPVSSAKTAAYRHSERSLKTSTKTTQAPNTSLTTIDSSSTHSAFTSGSIPALKYSTQADIPEHILTARKQERRTQRLLRREALKQERKVCQRQGRKLGRNWGLLKEPEDEV